MDSDRGRSQTSCPKEFLSIPPAEELFPGGYDPEVNRPPVDADLDDWEGMPSGDDWDGGPWYL